MITPGQVDCVPIVLLNLELTLDGVILKAEDANLWPATMTANLAAADMFSAIASRYAGKGWKVSHWVECDRVHLQVEKP